MVSLLTLAGCGLAGCGLAGCGDEDEGAGDDRVIVTLSFDDFAYVDAGISPRKLMERVRRLNDSVISTLRHADVTITAKKQVDVDLAHLEKEPVTVVDLDTGITRAALRVKYHFVALALAPRALATRRDLPLGALHLPTPAHPDEVVATCTAGGEGEQAAAGELWTVFDGHLDRCTAALAREQEAIDARRKLLHSPEREIVSREFERLLVPVVAHLRQRHVPGEEPAPNASVKARTPGVPGLLGDGPDDEDKTPVYQARDDDVEDSADEKELRRLARPSGGGLGQAQGGRSFGSSVYTAPNFGFLALVVVALGVLVRETWRQRRRNNR
jgi:hypothetical protein